MMGKDTVIGGTVLPPRELGRIGELQVFQENEKTKNRMIQSTAYRYHYSKLGPHYRAEGIEILVHVYKYILCMHSHLGNIHFFRKQK